MKKIVLLSSVLVLFLMACNSNVKQKKVLNKELTKSELIKKINAGEQRLFADSTAINKKNALALASDYQLFAARFPNDSAVPEYLYRAADILMNMGRPHQTLFIFNEIIKKYPDFDKISTCYFLRAFVYDDELKDYHAAEKYYKDFIDKYPHSDFVDDAQTLLNNLGKSPEEMIKEFGGK